MNLNWDKEYRDGGSITSDRRFTEIDFNKLAALEKLFRVSWNGRLWDILEANGTRILGKYNPKTKTLFIAGEKNMNNFLVKWMTENGYVSSSEYAILKNGGRVDISEFSVNDNKLFQCLISVFNNVSDLVNKDNVIDTFIDTHNQNYVFIIKNNDYDIEDKIKNNLSNMSECYNYINYNDITFKNNVLSIPLKNISDKYANGGGIERIDLFEDYENIPTNIQEILDKYSDDFEDGNWEGLAKALEEVRANGYTFEYYLDGQAYGLRPIDVPLNELKGYEDMNQYANGGGVEINSSLSEQKKWSDKQNKMYDYYVNHSNDLIDIKEDLKKAKNRNDKDEVKRLEIKKKNLESSIRFIKDNFYKYSNGGGVGFDVYDFDKKMSLINLDMIYEYSVKLDEMVTEESKLEEWVKMKLTKVEQNIADVKHSLSGWEKFEKGGMIFKKQLLHISKYAKDLINMIKSGSKLMSWQENKLAISADYIDGIYHHLDYIRKTNLDKLDEYLGKYNNGGTIGGVKIDIDFPFNDNDELNTNEIPKVSILKKYFNFDTVKGHIDYEEIHGNTNLRFYRDGDLILTIKGDYDEINDTLPVTITIKKTGEETTFNYHPRNSMGGVDFNKFNENLFEALKEINSYSAVISVEGFAHYVEKLQGLENAENSIKNIKENTKFQVVKGDVGTGKLVKSNDVIGNYANGGGIEEDYSDLKFASKQFSKTAEMLVKENLNNGEINVSKLKSIIGKEPNYPIQIVGSLKLEKCYLRPYYKIA